MCVPGPQAWQLAQARLLYACSPPARLLDARSWTRIICAHSLDCHQPSSVRLFAPCRVQSTDARLLSVDSLPHMYVHDAYLCDAHPFDTPVLEARSLVGRPLYNAQPHVRTTRAAASVIVAHLPPAVSFNVRPIAAHPHSYSACSLVVRWHRLQPLNACSLAAFCKPRSPIDRLLGTCLPTCQLDACSCVDACSLDVSTHAASSFPFETVYLLKSAGRTQQTDMPIAWSRVAKRREGVE